MILIVHVVVVIVVALIVQAVVVVHDFSEVETPLLIKYVKIEQRGKQSEQKKIAQKDENVFYCSCYQRKQCSSQILIMEK